MRQNPKISQIISHQEAVGVFFDSVKSLPQGMTVSDWSSKWNRWEGRRFSGAGITYLLEYPLDKILETPKSSPEESGPELVLRIEQVLGVLQFYEKNASNFSQLTLCTGLQRFSTDSIKTPFPYLSPWCEVFETPDDAIKASPDRVLNACISKNSARLPGGRFEKDPGVWKHSRYVASFEPQLCYGRVYYLIKIHKRRGLAGLDTWGDKADAGSRESAWSK
ncbi:hypothetical protein BKA65DRAFT_516140 [Rhexocercosporidium sp. MPI-PUGE-AT-0058]|nr:hypothetical protein BKA65DRAFT_516140 [Rhexocercosporidium sp. MPI-PUGE-AT-0058]